MAIRIRQIQNLPEKVNLLKASSFAFSKAKRWEQFITYFLFLLALSYPIYFAFSNSEEIKQVLFATSFLLAILIQAFYTSYKGNTIKGALFKEEFDCEVFGIPWKTTLKKPDYIEVLNYSLKYKGPEIRDWYSIKLNSNLPENTCIAICQRINTGWDIDLRKKYRGCIRFFLILYSISLFAFFVILRIDGGTMFSACFCVISFYNHYINLIRGHTIVIEKREYISEKLDDLILNKKDISLSQIRDIQDEIYYTRQESAKVPNFFFRFYKMKMNRNFDIYVENINNIFNVSK